MFFFLFLSEKYFISFLLMPDYEMKLKIRGEIKIFGYTRKGVILPTQPTKRAKVGHK